MKILLTGGAGFIGSHLCKALLDAGNEVAVFDNLSAGKKENVDARAKFVMGDICKKDAISSAAKGHDAIFHFAAEPSVLKSFEDPAATRRINVLGTENVLEAARRAGAKKFVFASTSAVYGEAKAMPTPEEAPTVPISNYGISKLEGERLGAKYAPEYGIDFLTLRYANIYGPLSTHGVMYDFYCKLKKNPLKLEILGDGKQSKSYLYISDAISATLAAFSHSSSGFDAYNIGSRSQTDVVSIAKMLCGELHLSPKFSYAGGSRGWAGDVPLMLLSQDKLLRTGWKEKIGMEEGIRKYVNWLSVQNI
jgi:UDP-glucose 4-epimerase